MNPLKTLNLAVSFLLELAMLGAFGYAGFHLDGSTAAHWLVGVGAPAVVITLWSIYLAPRSDRRLPDLPRLIVSFIAFELAAGALYLTNQAAVALALAVVAAINIVLASLWKQ